MKTTITNGTWTVKPLKSGNLKVFVEGKDADGNECDFWVATCPNEANANLIASAPEMLEALKNAEGVVRLASSFTAGKIKELVDKVEGK